MKYKMLVILLIIFFTSHPINAFRLIEETNEKKEIFTLSWQDEKGTLHYTAGEPSDIPKKFRKNAWIIMDNGSKINAETWFREQARALKEKKERDAKIAAEKKAEEDARAAIQAKYRHNRSPNEEERNRINELLINSTDIRSRAKAIKMGIEFLHRTGELDPYWDDKIR